jgi:2'-5' RNA ligase
VAENSLVIVAIPAKDDHVWKISSEKVPHLTLLYLGETDLGDNLQGVVEFVQHATNFSLKRFGLSVNRRGELGEDKADVLFFDKNYAKKVEEFRASLLKNDTINKAYLSVPQFPTWTPHLTLGYPETPAKPDDREYPGLSWVNFDRIAVWTGDSEGPEFLLESDDGLEVGMSDPVEKVLMHYGVKGMRWGVRRRRSRGADVLKDVKGRKISVDKDGHHVNSKGERLSDDAVKARTLGKRARTNPDTLDNNELQALVKRMNLEQQYGNMVGKKPKKLDRGHKFVKEALSIGNTGNQAIQFVNSPAGKLILQELGQKSAGRHAK